MKRLNLIGMVGKRQWVLLQSAVCICPPYPAECLYLLGKDSKYRQAAYKGLFQSEFDFDVINNRIDSNKEGAIFWYYTIETGKKKSQVV